MIALAVENLVNAATGIKPRAIVNEAVWTTAGQRVANG
jgi:hypothetical protein